jgi:two-component system, NarL family, sensor histidine kinase DesK
VSREFGAKVRHTSGNNNFSGEHRFYMGRRFPKTSEKPSWPSLFGVAGAAYIFIDPYRLGATALEWLWTGLTFTAFVTLSVIASIYWSERRIMRRVCVAMAVIAACFAAYRPAGACLYIFVAAYAPVATGGAIIASAGLIIGAIVAMLTQWHLRWPSVSPSWFPYVASFEALIVGAAITFAMRQQTSLRRALKTAEQERIARDLHDILGHTLSVIILKSELANRLIDHDLKRAKKEMEDVEAVARKALSEVREAISGYRSGDLFAEIERAQQTLETAGISVQRDYQPTALPFAEERTLALILREAITNVIRHAQATECKLSLKSTAESCELIVQDNGRGVSAPAGNGMIGIRERVAAIGGQVAWISSPGTELRVTVPLQGSQGT